MLWLSLIHIFGAALLPMLPEVSPDDVAVVEMCIRDSPKNERVRQFLSKIVR